MNAAYLFSIEKMRAELAWVTETQTRTSVAAATFDAVRKPALTRGCDGAVATKFWTLRWEYYCAPCRKYGWCGIKVPIHDGAVNTEPFRPSVGFARKDLLTNSDVFLSQQFLS